MAAISRFTIASRRGDGSDLQAYSPNSVEYTYVASAVNIGLAVLEQDRSKAMVAYLALLFDNLELQAATFGGDMEMARQRTDWFIAQLRANPPAIIVDDTLTNLDCLGYHHRGAWDGSDDEFPFRLQGIHLNGPVRRESNRGALAKPATSNLITNALLEGTSHDRGGPRGICPRETAI